MMSRITEQLRIGEDAVANNKLEKKQKKKTWTTTTEALVLYLFIIFWHIVPK